MNLLAHVLAITLAQAEPVPSVPSAPAQPTALVLSASVGVGIALGKVDDVGRAGSGGLNGVAKSVPFTLTAGYRFDPRWSADLNLTYAPIVLAGGCADLDPSTNATRVGAALRWHRLSQRIVRPWISLGLGYEYYRYTGGCTDVELSGIDFDFQVGADIHASPSWTVGPFASARVGTYVHMYAHGHDRSQAGNPTDEWISAGDLAIHEWLSIGLRGTFASTAVSNPSADNADYRNGLLFMPFVGVHRPFSDAFSLGFRAGFLAGYHVLPFVSVNGELAFDLMDANNVSEPNYVKAYVADLALSPLYHLQLAWGDIVVGPRIGGFRSACSDYSHEEIAHGLAYGLNAGIFGRVGAMALGMLLGYTRRYTTGTSVEPALSYQEWSAPNVSSATFAAIF
jgi:hypothetical protein